MSFMTWMFLAVALADEATLVQGFTVDAVTGVKLSKVRVFAEVEDDGNHRLDYLATTDVNGNFYFKSLAPGV